MWLEFDGLIWPRGRCHGVVGRTLTVDGWRRERARQAAQRDGQGVVDFGARRRWRADQAAGRCQGSWAGHVRSGDAIDRPTSDRIAGAGSDVDTLFQLVWAVVTATALASLHVQVALLSAAEQSLRTAWFVWTLTYELKSNYPAADLILTVFTVWFGLQLEMVERPDADGEEREVPS